MLGARAEPFAITLLEELSLFDLLELHVLEDGQLLSKDLRVEVTH